MILERGEMVRVARSAGKLRANCVELAPGAVLANPLNDRGAFANSGLPCALAPVTVVLPGVQDGQHHDGFAFDAIDDAVRKVRRIPSQ